MPAPAARPLHHRPGLLLAVLLGGAAGTSARSAVTAALPYEEGWPVATWAANLVGAFLLGLLLEALGRRGPDAGTRRLLRLGVGTGLLGAFTTYSALAVETDLLLRDGRPGLAAAYALGTVLPGLLLTALGVRVGGVRR